MIRRLMYRAIHAVFMAPEGGEGGGGGDQVTPEIARTYLSERVSDPATITGMKDPDVITMYGKSKPVWDKVEQTAAERATANWREGIAGDDKTHLETLNRFASPKALYDSYHQLRSKMSNGELKAVTPFPEKGTPEEQATWRGANSIPDEPGKYEIKLAEGVKIDEADAPAVDGFKKFAFENHLPASVVNGVVNWWIGAKAAATEQAQEQFAQAKVDTAATLGKEWGADYKPNMNRISGLLQQTIANDEGGQKLQASIMRAIETDPAFARHYAAMALELNPAGALVSGDRGASEGSVTDELKKIDGLMATNRKAYDKDETMQARYRTLLAGYEKMTGKGWNPHAQAG